MRRSTLIIVGLAIMLSLPTVVFSDCLDFGRPGPLSWHVQNERTIIFYDSWGTTPIAQVTLQTCRVNELSVIRLSQRYLCDTDKVIVDNRPCSIVTITSASSGSLQLRRDRPHPAKAGLPGNHIFTETGLRRELFTRH
jgi:hypothetical protein